MDLLFIEAFVIHLEFSKVFLDKIDHAGKPFEIIQAERSKFDNELVESDLTIIYRIVGKKYALLIENIIDAIAIVDQYERYINVEK